MRQAMFTSRILYVADTYSGLGIVKWSPANNTSTDLPGGQAPYGVAVDGSGNVYIAEYGIEILKWSAVNSKLTTLVSSGLNFPRGVALDGAGNVYISDTGNNAIKELPNAFVDQTPKLESLAAGSDALPAVVPADANLLAPFTPTSDQSWLTITGITNGVVNFAFTATPSNRTGYINLLGQPIPITQGGPSFSLGTTTLTVGPSAGSNTVVLGVAPNFATWTAITIATWLHLSAANQSGTGSTNVVFSYDANPGPTRSSTLIIAGQPLTVTQAGSTYVEAGTLTALVSSELVGPEGVAVDGAGNVYIADTGNGAIKEWTAANSNLTTLVSTGLSYPVAVAVDDAGNVYIADRGNNAIKEWMVGNSNVTILVSGLSYSCAVAVDGAGNVYFTDTYNGLIEKWLAANGTVSTLVSPGLDGAYGLAVDGEGNVYIDNTGDDALEKWIVANGNVTTLVPFGPTLNRPQGLAVDGMGNVYIADTDHSAIKKLLYAFVDPTPKLEGLPAGNDDLPSVLPATENLLPPFAPTSDQSWLTITGITNGVVSFSFTANTGAARTANITLLGQIIPITQGAVGRQPTLTGLQLVGNGVFQFGFTNNPSGVFTVLSSTNLSLPLSNWTVVGTAGNIGSGQFQFTSQPTTNDAQRFYGVRSP